MATALRAPAEQLTLSIPEATRRPVFRLLPWADIDPDPDQPRKDADVGLRAAIAANGMLEPVKVRPHPDVAGRWMLIDGERRYRSAEGLLTELPAVIREDLDQRPTRLRTQLVFNSGKQLSAMEKAHVLDELLRESGATLASVARDTGLARSTIGDHVSLMQLGPWIPLLESGDVASSFATRALVRYAGCPDHVHEEAIKGFLEIFDTEEIRRDLTYFDFQDAIDEQYRVALYPLSAVKTSGWNPEFSTKAHDTECNCGRIARSEVGDGKTRDFCGNPDWWKPLLAAAKKAAKAKEKATGATSSSGSRAPARAKLTLYLPDGHGEVTLKNSYVSDPPPGMRWMTDREGRWFAPTHHPGVECFDPRLVAGNISPKALILVKTHDGHRAAAKTDATAAARATWADGWKARREQILAERREALKAKSFVAVGELAQDALAILLTDAWNIEYFDSATRKRFDGMKVLIELAQLIEIPSPKGKAFANGRQANPMAAWCEAAGAAMARRLLRAWLVARRDGWKDAGTDVESEEDAALADIAKIKCPWLKAPKGGKPKAGTPATETVWDDSDDETIPGDD